MASEELKRPALITLMAVLQWVGALFWFALTVVIRLIVRIEAGSEST